MKTVNVKIQYKNGNTAVAQVPVKQVVFAMTPSYRGNIVELTPAAVKATVSYLTSVTGEEPDKSVMRIVDMVESDMTCMAIWTNGIRVVHNY